MEATNLKITSLFLNGSEYNNRCFACFYIQNVTRDCQELSRMIEMVSQTKNFDIIAVLPDTEHNKMQLTRGTATLDSLMSLSKPWELMVIPKDLYLLEPADQMPCYDLRKFHAIVRNGGDPCDYIRMRNFIQSVETDYAKRQLGTSDCNESLLFGIERRDYPTSWFYPENGMHYAMTGILMETPDKEKFKGFVIDVPLEERLSFHKNFSLPGYICAWMFEKDPIINIDFRDYDFQPSKLQGDLSTFINGKPVIMSEDIVKHLSYKEPEIEIPYTNWGKDVKHPVDFEDFAENARSYEEDVSSYSQGAPEEKRMVKEDIITPFKEKVKEYDREVNEPEKEESEMSDVKPEESTPESILEDSGSTLEDFKKWVREVIVELLETERNGEDSKETVDDLKRSYVDDAAELDIANVKEDTEMANKIKINTAVLTTFPLINCCVGKLCYTKDGNLFWVLEMNSFGNPKDKCWKLILELGLPVFYQNSHEKESMDTVYTRISNPEDPKWYCSPNTGKLGFYPDGINPVIANFTHIGVLLTNPFDESTECRVAYGAHKRPVHTEDAIRAMIDCICEHYGRVPKDLVNAIVNYYRED